MKKNIDRRYTIPNRLTDVIRLISVLAISNGVFKTKKDLEVSIRGIPLSATDWIDIANQHPEFFRPNADGLYIALLLRSYLEETEINGLKTRKPLSVTETQKLIESAISLHDKEIARHQKDAFKIPIKTAWISGTILIIISLINSGVALYSNVSNNKKLDSLKITMDRIEAKLKK